MRVAVVASAQIFGGFQNLPRLQSLDFPAFFGLSHLFPPRPFYSHIFDTDLVTSHALIDAYGADRVLFGTDYPMWDPQHELACLRGMHLAPETERKILYDNAAALFGLEGEN